MGIVVRFLPSLSLFLPVAPFFPLVGRQEMRLGRRHDDNITIHKRKMRAAESLRFRCNEKRRTDTRTPQGR